MTAVLDGATFPRAWWPGVSSLEDCLFLSLVHLDLGHSPCSGRVTVLSYVLKFSPMWSWGSRLRGAGAHAPPSKGKASSLLRSAAWAGASRLGLPWLGACDRTVTLWLAACLRSLEGPD